MKEGREGNNVFPNSVCNEGGEWGAQTKVLFAKSIIDLCAYVLKETKIL